MQKTSTDFDNKRRYARHHVLPGFGAAGQAALEAAQVLVVGAGGIGSPLLTYLASSGVGRIVMCDPDRVDSSNLPRQILFEPGDVGRWKVDAARDRLEELNPALQLETHATDVETWLARAPTPLHGITAVLDGSDTFNTRLAVNAACVAAGVPLISGAMIGWQGQIGVFAGHLPDQPCYQCWVGSQPHQTDSCQTNGVLAPLGAVVAGWMAIELCKLAAQAGEALRGRMLLVDGLAGHSRVITLTRDPECHACAVHHRDA